MVETAKYTGLRDYQLKGKEQVYELFRNGTNKVCLVLCMGLGKTTLVSDIISDGLKYNRKTLVLVHRDNLVRQFAARLKNQYNIDSGLVLGSAKKEFSLPIQVASRQSMIRLKSIFARDYFNLIVVDEAHYIASDSYMNIINYFTGCKLIGITATPFRKDNKPLGDIFEDMVLPIKAKEAVEKGYLVEARYSYVSKINMAGVKIKGSDYDEDEMLSRFNQFNITSDVVAKAKNTVGKTLIYCINVAHTKEIYEALINNGLKAEYVIGDTSVDDRLNIYNRFEHGNIQFLVNCDILTEGADFPIIRNIFIVRVTKSLARYLQIVGRGLRPDVKSGKQYCDVIDFGANVLEHGDFLDYDEDLSLKKGAIAKLNKPKPRQCPVCAKVMIKRICSCGYESDINEKERIDIEGVTFEVYNKNVANIKRIAKKKWDQLKIHELPIYAKIKGLHADWALHRIAESKEISKDVYNWKTITRRILAAEVDQNKHLYE